MKPKKLLAASLAGVLCLGLAAGCSAQNEEEAEDLAPVSVAYLNKAGYETIIVADQKAFFEECAAPVELLTVTGSGQQSVEALLAGSADIAATGQGPVADALGQYPDDIVVLCGTNCNTDSQVIVAGPSMTGDKQIVAYDKTAKNSAEVKASFESAAAALDRPIKLGVQKGATTESSVKSWLSKMEISYNDFATEGDGIVTLVDVKANTLPTVLATGEDIDMMAASQPYPDTAIGSVEGSYRVGSNADTNSYDVACYITTKAVYAEKEASIKAFIATLKQTTDYMADEANTDECVELCANAMGADAATVQSAFDLADWNTAMTDTMIESIQKAAAKKGYDEITADVIKAACPLADWLNEL